MSTVSGTGVNIAAQGLQSSNQGQIIDIPDRLNVDGQSIDAVVSSVKGSQISLSTSTGENIILNLPKNPFAVGENINLKVTQEQVEIKSQGVIRIEQLAAQDKVAQNKPSNSLNIDLSKLTYHSKIEGVLKNPNIDFARLNISTLTQQTYQFLSNLITSSGQNVKAGFTLVANPTKVKDGKDRDVSRPDSIVEKNGLRLKGVTSLADSLRNNLTLKTILGDFNISGHTKNIEEDYVFFLALNYIDHQQNEGNDPQKGNNQENSVKFNTLYKKLLENNPQHKEYLTAKIPNFSESAELFIEAVNFIKKVSNDNFDISDGKIQDSELLDEINDLLRAGQGINAFTIPVYDNDNFHTLLLKKQNKETDNVKYFSIELETSKYGEISLEGRVYKQRGKKLFDLDISIANADSEIQKEIAQIYHGFQDALGVSGAVRFRSLD